MKVRRVLKQISVFALIGTILATDITPAYAATSVAGVNETQDVSTDDTAECEVYAELGSIFRVIIPKKITLSGSTKTGSYTVDVEGDIGGTDTVKVVPEESFTLTSTGLASQTAKVSQDKTAWSWNEILPDSKTIGNGSISASGITAGSWNGSFWFNISLEEGSGTEDSKVEISMDDDTTKNITIDAGDSVQIDIFVGDENVNDEVTWSSDNENVTVQNGLIEVSESVTDGETANITATIGDKSITVIITINKKQKESLKLSTSDVAMGVNDSVQVNAYLDGVIANDKVTWSSDNENITVTNGLIESTANAEVGDTATVTVTASSTENLSAMANVLSDLGIVTYASAAEDLSIDFVVTIVDIEYSVEEINLKAGESIDVTAKIIPDTVTGTVTWSQTAISGINLVKNGNTVTVKVASDMEAGKSYNLIATYGDYSKTLKINIITDHTHSYTGAVTKEATCTEDGVKTFTCECGDSYTEDIPTTGHNYVNHICTKCNAQEAGLYDADGNLLCSWEESGIDVETDYSSSSSDSDYYKNATTSGYYVLTNNYQAATKIIIPDDVTNIGNHAFTYCLSLTSVTIPSSVTSIGYDAFSNCKKLTSITIPDSVTSIDDGAFYNCTSLTSVTIPNSVTSIGRYTFKNCTSLTSITIGSGVTSIGEGAFYDCISLTSVTIPNSVTSIGDYAFENCTDLTSVTIGNGVTSIGDYAFDGCSSLANVEIPFSVTSIGEGAFYLCEGLTNITIGSGVTSIGEWAFYYCSGLTSITIPSSVTSIGEGAFRNCTKLTSVTFKTTSGWYVGDSAGEKTTAISSSDLANKSTAATYLKSTYGSKYWTR